MHTHTARAPGSAPEGMLASALIRASRPLLSRSAVAKLKAAQAHLTGFHDAPLPTIGGVSLDRATVGDARRAAGAPTLSRTHDDAFTFDQATIDSLGAFGINQLEQWDRTLNEPLYTYTWSRDIQLRTDVGMGHELASYSLMDYRAPGGITPNGKNWGSKLANVIPGPSVDMAKIAQNLWPWEMELSWTLYELASAQLTGMAIDDAKYRAMQMKWNMDTDAQVYVGDTQVTLTSGGNPAGLLNSAAVIATNAAATGTGSSTLWANKTPAQILTDVNAALTAAWTASGYAVVPDQMRIPPVQMAQLVSTINSTAGTNSVLTFLNQNNLSLSTNGRALNIQAIKWLTAALRGVSTDRLYVYTNDKKYVQFPMVPLQRTPQEQRSTTQMVTYYGKLGAVEHRYPETELYVDGI